MGDLYVEIWGNYWKKKFFINQKKSWKKISKQGILFEPEICEEACQDLLKSYVMFGGGLEGCNEKMGKQQKDEIL